MRILFLLSALLVTSCSFVDQCSTPSVISETLNALSIPKEYILKNVISQNIETSLYTRECRFVVEYESLGNSLDITTKLQYVDGVSYVKEVNVDDPTTQMIIEVMHRAYL